MSGSNGNSLGGEITPEDVELLAKKAAQDGYIRDLEIEYRENESTIFRFVIPAFVIPDVDRGEFHLELEEMQPFLIGVAAVAERKE